MRFGPVPVAAAKDAVLAHSVMAGGRKLPKGRVITCEDMALLRSEGVAVVTVAQLDPGDVGEDAAAVRVAQALVPDPALVGLVLTLPHSGRVNLVAVGPGVVMLDAAAVLRLNLIDPGITLATLAPLTRVTAGMLVGTVKIITYAVGGAALVEAEAVASGAIRVQPVVRATVGLILTEVPGGASSLTAKGRDVMERRVKALGMTLSEVIVVLHDRSAIAAAIRRVRGEMILLLTSAATSDLHDDGPEALRDAGGQVARFGMPVDPGNLLFYGALGDRPFIGLPGCARSIALNGADWVLERLACGLTVTEADIAAMGVGGLLKEIPIRPQPRERARE